jgi:hypothetical protein
LSSSQSRVSRIEDDGVTAGTVRWTSSHEVDSRHGVRDPVDPEAKLADGVVIVPCVMMPAMNRDRGRPTNAQIRGEHYLSSSDETVELRGLGTRTAIRHRSSYYSIARIGVVTSLRWLASD